MNEDDERISVVETDDLDIRELRLITDGAEPDSWIKIGRAILGYMTEDTGYRGSWAWSVREGPAYDIPLLERIIETLKEIPVPPYEEYEAAFGNRLTVEQGLMAATPQGYEPEDPAPCPTCGKGVTKIIGWPRASLEPCGHTAMLVRRPDGSFDLAEET